MKTIAISATERNKSSKNEAKKIREQGSVPCVLYGGKSTIHFSAPALDFKKLVYTPEVQTVSLSIDGKEYNAIMQDIQFHPVTDRIIHIDFLEIVPGKPVVVDIPVLVTGNAEGVKKGGQLLTKMRKLKVKALAEKLPEAVTVNVDKLDIGNAIRVGDLKIEGVEFLDSSRNIITAVKTARKVEEEKAPEAAAPAAGAAAPAAGAPGAAAPAADAKKAEPAKK